MTISINITRMTRFRLLAGILGFIVTFGGAVHGQQTIIWSSGANAVNLTSGGLPMTNAFKFELGVFKGTFVPTAENTAQWAANWQSAKEISYSSKTRRFAGDFVVSSNTSPFTLNKSAYIWGSKGNASNGEWILFRAASWRWPSAGEFDNIQWDAKDATAVLGEINVSGSPHLMKSVRIVDSAPAEAKVSWAEWQAAYLGDSPNNRPNDDADGDGVANILEFAFGTDIDKPGAPLHTPVSNSNGHLVITVPRRQDRQVNLAVEVSSDLQNWYSGPEYTEVLEDGLNGLMVRDLTPIGPENLSRFMRVQVSEP